MDEFGLPIFQMKSVGLRPCGFGFLADDVPKDNHLQGKIPPYSQLFATFVTYANYSATIGYFVLSKMHFLNSSALFCVSFFAYSIQRSPIAAKILNKMFFMQNI